MRLWDFYHPDIPEFLKQAAQTPALQRLKDIGMNCGCEYTSFPLFANIAPYSRYDHSMGVALIIWHFTEDKAQATCGLLHDIATPVFAHVVDFLRGDHLTQESTERGTADLIRNSASLSPILARYNIAPDAVTDSHRYPIADNPSPGLCADRLEYTLGNAVNYGILTTEQVRSLYADLTVGSNERGEPELMFCHPDAAYEFAQAALACSGIYVSDPDRYAMQSLAELLKCAMEQGILSEADLYLQEQTVIQTLQESPLASQWTQFRSYHRILRQDTPGTDGTWFCVPAKKRCIDPYIRSCGRTSEVYPAFREQLRDFLTSRQDHWLSAI